ncbi:DUF6228 family protein [Streptomyces sp. V4-01]|uniref:DUF6228 family protein n=1 Tax=Actinacidiphila polyblastidii TaxID=3110430 RepID=A0ABU7PEG3_9ACTN|nr:DUF6228 family protein [Streptomyces sp. V4-01]
MLIHDARSSQMLCIGDPGQGVHIIFSTPERPYGGDPALDIPIQIKGAWVDIKDLIRTLNGDGLVEFFSSLTGKSRIWTEARIWQSSEEQLKISAERTDGRVILTWGIWGKAIKSETAWYFETVTSHACEQQIQEFSEGFNALFQGNRS